MTPPRLPEMSAPGYDSVTREERLRRATPLGPWFYTDDSGLVKTSRRTRRGRKFRALVRSLLWTIAALIAALLTVAAALIWNDMRWRERYAAKPVPIAEPVIVTRCSIVDVVRHCAAITRGN